MRKWRSRSWGGLALLAMLAAILPSFAWSCPVTGRLGSAAFVCQGMTHQCAHADSRCCIQVQVPSGSGQRAVLPTSLATNTPSLAPGASNGSHHDLVDTAILPTSGLNLHLAHQLASCGLIPSFFFCSRHGPSPSSGRAPPVV